MKLQPDCIRAVLLAIEDSHKYYRDDSGNVTTDPVYFEALCKALPNYEPEDVYYTLSNLEQAGYISMKSTWSGGSLYMCQVNYMTFKGHEFLNEIHDSKRWEIVKKGLTSIRSYSLDAISAVAKGVAGASIQEFVKQLGL